MFRVGVILVALSVLFALMALAFAALETIAHPLRAAVALSGLLSLGIWPLLG